MICWHCALRRSVQTVMLLSLLPELRVKDSNRSQRRRRVGGTGTDIKASKSWPGLDVGFLTESVRHIRFSDLQLQGTGM